MADPTMPGGLDPDEIPTRSDTNPAADFAGEFLAQAASEGCAQGCAGGCGCVVFVAVGLALTVGSAVAAMVVR